MANRLTIHLRDFVLATILIMTAAASPVARTSSAGETSQDNLVARSNNIPEAWPSGVSIERLSDIGRRKAIIFSPDFAAPGNREFYEKLGFLYVEDTSWQRALNEIVARNYWHPEDQVETVFLETHGTNGNGLKLQMGPAPRAARSYIAIGALQEILDRTGVRLCVIGACNAGRLFRPEIYKTLDPRTRDPLFLPATLGIINATKGYDPSRSKMIVARRAESEIETTSDGDTSELSAQARRALGLDQPRTARRSRGLHFTVSNLLIQLLTHDPRLKLTSSGYESEKSRNDLSASESDALFDRFVAYLDSVAAQVPNAVRQPAASTALHP